MYNYIINPITKRKVKINGNKGIEILQKYLNQKGGGKSTKKAAKKKTAKKKTPKKKTPKKKAPKKKAAKKKTPKKKAPKKKAACNISCDNDMDQKLLNIQSNRLCEILHRNISKNSNKKVLLLGDGEGHGFNAIGFIINFIINMKNLKLPHGNVYLELYNDKNLNEKQYEWYKQDIENIERIGFNVIGLETPYTVHPIDKKIDPVKWTNENRIKESNPIWANIINDTLKKDTLNIISVGSHHNYTTPAGTGLQEILEKIYKIQSDKYELINNCQNFSKTCCDDDNNICNPNNNNFKMTKTFSDYNEWKEDNVNMIYGFDDCFY
jgi:hypothetical protein